LAENGGLPPFAPIGTRLVYVQAIAADAAATNGFREAKMIKLGKIGQGFVATFGAIVLTATAVGAAVGPARAVETAPVSLVAAQVSVQALA
jgi:hypothetical protein